MITRRLLILSSCAAAVAGCQTTTAPQTTAAAAPTPAPTSAPTTSPARRPTEALTTAKARPYRIVSLDVSLSPDFKRNDPDNGITDQQIFAALKPGLTQGLSGANAKGDIPVRATAELISFNFAGGAAMMMGGTSSIATTRVIFYDAESGAQLFRPAIARAAIEGRPGGLIGATMIQPPQAELQLVAQSVGKATRRHLYGFGN